MLRINRFCRHLPTHLPRDLDCVYVAPRNIRLGRGEAVQHLHDLPLHRLGCLRVRQMRFERRHHPLRNLGLLFGRLAHRQRVQNGSRHRLRTPKRKQLNRPRHHLEAAAPDIHTV